MESGEALTLISFTIPSISVFEPPSVIYGRIRLVSFLLCSEKQNYRNIESVVSKPQTIRYYPIHSVRQVDKRLKVVLDSYAKSNDGLERRRLYLMEAYK